MILADKIIDERKKLGLSQEEMAEKLSVSRQAVSKWESAQSIPDLQKIIAMSELFSVSTDYLLKDDIEAESSRLDDADTDHIMRLVSMEEANAFLQARKAQSSSVSLGVMFCILCPVMLIFLNGLAESRLFAISESTACAIGLALLFLLIAAAVYLFVQNGARTERFDYLEKEAFETAYGVSGLIKGKQADYKPTYTRFLCLGIVLCVLSPLPLIITALINEADWLAASMTSVLLCIVALGVYMIIRVSTVMDGYKILLQEGDYRKVEKENKKAAETVGAIYWSLVTAAYLAWSFLTMKWESTWIVWPIAGVLCAPVMAIVKAFRKE